MADSVLASCAEAVKTAIEAHDFGRQFAIERNYAEFDLAIDEDELQAVRIDVFPVRHGESDLRSRGEGEYQPIIDICVRRKFGNDDAEPDRRITTAAIDDLVKFTEQIHEFLAAETLADTYNWVAAEFMWCPNKAHLRNNRQFTSLLRVTYETSTTLP